MKTGTKKAEEAFPTEIWKMIFGNLAKEDMVSCYNTSTLFQSILETNIFSQVFEMVHAHVSGSSLQLEKTDILSCRLVSSEWRQMIDTFLQSRLELPCYRRSSVDFLYLLLAPSVTPPTGCGAILLERQKVEQANRLVTRITENRKVKKMLNVFCGRHLIIVDTVDANVENNESKRFHDIVSRLLESCGGHIWHLSVSISIVENLAPWLFNTFWKWLRLLPNLKMLTFQATLDDVRRFQLEMLPELQLSTAREPFPYMPHLATLYINGPPEIVLTPALEANPHVGAVEVAPLPYQLWTDQPMNIQGWRGARVTELCVSLWNHAELKALTLTGWPLEKLTLSYASGINPFSGTELENLRNFGETLKYLRLIDFKNSLGSGTSQWQLQLPQLEELDIFLFNDFTLDFILPLVSLKNLKISMAVADDEGEPQITLQSRECAMGSLYESNIWELLPALRNMEVQLAHPKRIFNEESPSYTSPPKYKYFRCNRRERSNAGCMAN